MINKFNIDDFYKVEDKIQYINQYINSPIYSYQIDWIKISLYQYLTEDFMRKFKHKIYWPFISECQNLSETFIEESQDRVDWYWISKYQTLSEPFIREFQHRVDWQYIFENKKIKLSKEFIFEMTFKGYILNETIH